jgi:hypothetical protein
MGVADFAKRIAESEVKERRIVDHAFTSGLLHDVGLIILATKKASVLDEAVARARAAQVSLFEVERDMLGLTHAQIGACLLELWGLPDAVVEAIGFHDLPSARPRDEFVEESADQLGGYASPRPAFAPLTAVHVANHFSEVQSSQDKEFDLRLDSNYLCQLGFDTHIERWRELCFDKSE